MKGIVYERYGPPEVLELIEVVKPINIEQAAASPVAAITALQGLRD